MKTRIIAVTVIALCLAAAARADETSLTRAFSALGAADTLFRTGRIAAAYTACLDLLREYPTWWLPTVRAGVAARVLGLPEETWKGYLVRARGLSPWGSYLDLVTTLAGAEEGRQPQPASPALDPSDPQANRLLLVRAKALESRGDDSAAAAEYREILKRNPRCVTAMWRLARISSRQGRVEEARILTEMAAAASLFPARGRTLLKGACCEQNP